MTEGIRSVLTPTGIAVVAVIVMYWSFETRIESRVEKRVKQEVETAVQLESLKKGQEQHREKLWVIEGEVNSLKTHNHVDK